MANLVFARSNHGWTPGSSLRAARRAIGTAIATPHAKAASWFEDAP